MHGFLKPLFVTLVFGIGFTTSSVATTVKISEEVQGFLFAKLDDIPAGPSPDVSGSLCESFTKQDPKFEEAKYIEEKGWTILDEIPFAQYRIVAFAGQFESVTGTCNISQSNIAIFESGNLTGLFYLGSPEENLIGALKLMDAGFIRIFSGDFAQKLVGELHLSNEGLVLVPVSQFTPYCNGRAIVPNTLGKSIKDGREVLFKFGFKPVLNEQISESWERKYFPGINEVVGCSNGIPWCLFEYENDYSMVVLSTLGDYEIIGDGVSCK